MTRSAAILCTLGILVLAGCGDESGSGPVTLDWFIFNEPSGAPVRVAERCSQESGGRYDIELRYLPSLADAQREQLVRRLAAEDDTIDLIGMDIIWTGEFANAGWIREVPGAIEGRGRGVYNVVDDEPAPVADWLPAAAAAVGAPAPRRVPRWLGRLFAGEFASDDDRGARRVEREGQATAGLGAPSRELARGLRDRAGLSRRARRPSDRPGCTGRTGA